MTEREDVRAQQQHRARFLAGKGSPTAVACERTIRSWSKSAWSGSIRTFASEPNPVVTP